MQEQHTSIFQIAPLSLYATQSGIYYV